MHTFKRSAALALAAVVAIAGCSGSDGSNGTNGTNGSNGVSTGTLSGAVTISGTSNLPVVGATVTLSPASAAAATTDASGNYSFANLPVGVYTVTYAATNFTSQTKTVSVLAATTSTQNVALVATSKVVVAITTSGTASPGGTLNIAAVTTPLDGSTVQSVAWTTGIGAPVTFGSTSAASTTAQLPALSVFKDNLFRVLDISPVADPDNNAPPEIPLVAATVQNRINVQAINHFDLERAGEVVLTAAVTTTSGTYTVTKNVAAALPYKVTTGLNSVPLNVPVVVHGFVDPSTPQTSWSYTLTGPSGDATSLLDSATSRHVVFTPTASGKYTLTESVAAKSIDIYVGTWVGAIDPAATLAATDPSKPVGDSNCLACHDDSTAPDKFTPWAQSGHAAIFTDNVNAGGHYTKACFDCHTVGFDETATNNGIDEQSDYASMLSGIFTVAGSPAANPNNWKTILGTYPNSAKMANIQCENCHGPQAVTGNSHSGAAQAALKAARVSMDAGVCGRCHGEPARHGRYQEWALSGHGNYETAISEGTQANCAGCHTAQGSSVYFAQLEAGNPTRTITLPAGLTADTALPQTCSVCHDPHNPGSTSSLGTNANPRIMDNTPMLPAGFAAIGVGKGAMCITCHNSRNGGWNNGVANVANLHEDGDAHFGTLTSMSAPHEAAQGDVIMGRNAYFVDGVRGPHSYIPNVCVSCHMDSVAAPSEIGYNTQTNHTMEANLTICAKCHGTFDGAGLQAATIAGIADLKSVIEAKLVQLYETPGTTIEYVAGRNPWICINAACLPFSSPATRPSNSVLLIDYLTGKASTQVDTFAKANWNFELVSVDNSGGVHNPSFVQDVIFRTTQKVSALATP